MTRLRPLAAFIAALVGTTASSATAAGGSGKQIAQCLKVAGWQARLTSSGGQAFVVASFGGVEWTISVKRVAHRAAWTSYHSSPPTAQKRTLNRCLR